MRTTRALAIMATITLVLGTVSFMLPQETKASDQVCDFGSGVEALQKIQASPESDSPQQVVTELNIRKNLLKISVSCLNTEIKSLDGQLEKLQSDSPEVTAFGEWLHRQMEETISFYNYKQTQIDDLGLKGTKDLAKEIAARRIQKDSPLEDLVSTFLDWNTNQALFDTGTKRFSDIKKTLDAFELPSDHEIVLLEKEAAGIFKDALLENQNAWKDLANLQTDIAQTENKESLEKLAKAYSVLLKISDVSKKTLPL